MAYALTETFDGPKTGVLGRILTALSYDLGIVGGCSYDSVSSHVAVVLGSLPRADCLCCLIWPI